MDNTFWIQEQYGDNEKVAAPLEYGDDTFESLTKIAEATRRLEQAAWLKHDLNGTPRERGGWGQEGHARPEDFADEVYKKGNGYTAFKNCQHPDCVKDRESLELLHKLYTNIPSPVLHEAINK